MIDGLPLTFFLPLVVHALAALTIGVTGVIAFSWPKRRESHPQWGERYLWAYIVFLCLLRERPARLVSLQREESMPASATPVVDAPQASVSRSVTSVAHSVRPMRAEWLLLVAQSDQALPLLPA